MENIHEEVLVNKTEPVPPPLLSGPSTANVNRRKCCSLNKNRSTLSGRNCSISQARESWDRLFDEGYRADVEIHTDNDTIIIYAHASILGIASPVFKSMFKKSKRTHHISINGVPSEAVRIFTRFLYSSCYEEAEMEEHILSLLVLSHAFAVPQLKQECEHQLEHKLLNMENVVDVFQLAVLCDAPRLSIICQRFVLGCFKAASSSAGWKAMRASHPHIEKKLLESLKFEDHVRSIYCLLYIHIVRQKEMMRKVNERKVYLELYEAMEALVRICRDGRRPSGEHDQEHCKYEANKGLESLLQHFCGCKLRVAGGCSHCKRMKQLLELHSRICADSDVCRLKQRMMKENKKKKKNKDKDEMKWKILVRKIMRTKSITGAPYFTLALS
ncbi:putative chromatin remodeling & transcription regulator BTB-POZ family [Helianthus annuus]|nr:putative chromatin remodeling & transcription regulator BTB-POZ family [Helianthus annuus]